MEKALYSMYTKEFSLSAVRLVIEAGVSASGFHASRSRGSSRRVQEDGRLEIEIRAAPSAHAGNHGPERLQRDLAAHGVRVGVHRIKCNRRKLGL
jgi:putative transposase